MNSGTDQDEGNFSTLPLIERLGHKLWKARLHGYQELNQLFTKAAGGGDDIDDSITIFWRDPSLFGDYVTDSNVVAQEQAVAALESLLKNVGLPPRIDLKTAMSNWIPALVEKGLASSRAMTKNKSMECILLICSFDESITESVQLVLPFFSKKLPKLVAASINCVSELISSFGFTNVIVNNLLPELLDPLAKLAGHADRNVRAQTMTLIVEIYKSNGCKRLILDELLLNKLKPIQQNDLEKLFSKADLESASGDGSKRLFQWQEQQKKIQEQMKEQHDVDKDGDTLMEMKTRNVDDDNSKADTQDTFDPFDMFPEEAILDKLPSDFHRNIASAKWKDRVDTLQEFWDNVLCKVKKLKSERQDYSEILSIYAQIIQRDVNVQAVTIAAQSIQAICDKLRFPRFSKHYVTIVFAPLLERTKEKKPSVIESIRSALGSLCRCYSPLGSETNSEDMLQEILQFMKHKIPQVRMESTSLFTFVLRELPVSKNVVEKYLEADITPAVIRIVNDTQPTIRNVGFECFAELLRVMSRDQYLCGALEKLDNLKRKKIQECCDKLPKSSPQVQSTDSRRTDESRERNVNQIRPSSSSSIPSKRGASSPLKKIVKASSPNVQKSRILLTSRSLATPGSPSTIVPQNLKQPLSYNNTNIQLQKLMKEKQEWTEERFQLLDRVSELSSVQNRIKNENELLQEKINNLQADMHEKGLQIRSKDLQLGKLQDRISQLEHELQEQQQHKQHQQRQISSSEASAVSTNLGVRSISSSSFEPITTRAKHLRTPSESSDDLPRRVDSLQLSHEKSSHANDIVNEESWKRAAEVTSQLKARIERMRAKTRGISNNF